MPPGEPTSGRADAPADPHPRGAAREERLRAVLEECLRRRSRGEVVTDEQVIVAHPELMPELARELSLLRLIERARAASRTASAESASRSARAGAVSAAGTVDWLDGYEVVGEVHRGGQGVVYEAIQRSTGRRVAVKVRRESFFADPHDAERFQREVEILAQLDHPGIVGVIDSGVFEGRVYFVMDFVDGAPIDEFVSARALSVREVLGLFEKIAGAVNAAHLRGVIHRDLKPANILVDGAGEPHLLDFGLARLLAEIGEAARQGQTMTGQFVGSLPWASPEQAEGQPSKIDLRTDVYSLGVIAYQMLTGQMPYRVSGGGSGEIGLKSAISVIVNARPARPSTLRSGIDADVDTIVLKCLSKERQRRYQSAGELAEDVRRYLESRPIAARPPSLRYQFGRFARRNRALVAAGAAVAAALAIGAVTTLVQLVRAREAERLAESRRVEAEAQAYIANIAAADAALRMSDGPGARARLAAAPESLRHWEWKYLMRMADRSSGVLSSAEPVGMLARAAEGSVVGLARSGLLQRWNAGPGKPAPVWSVRAGGEAGGEPVVMRTSADGRRVVVAGTTWAAVHDAADGREIRRWVLSDRPVVSSAAISADGSRVIVAGRASYGLHALDVESGADTLLNEDFVANVRDLDLSRDGRIIASIEQPDVVVRDGGTGRVLRRERLATPRFSGRATIRLSPDGTLAAATVAAEIRLLDTSTLAVRHDLRGHLLMVRAVEFAEDGRTLVSGSDDAALRLWDVGSGACEATLIGHEKDVSAACFASSGIVVSSSMLESGPRRWDRAEPPLQTRAPLLPGDVLVRLAGDHGGEEMVVLTQDRRLVARSIDGRTQRTITTLPELEFGALSLSGRWGAGLSRGLELLWLDLDSGSVRSLGNVPEAPTRISTIQNYYVAASPDGRLAAWRPGAPDGVHIVSTDNGAEVRHLRDDQARGESWRHMRFTPDGRLLLCATEHSVRAFDTRTWAVVSTVPAAERSLTGLSVRADSAVASVMTVEGHVIVWEPATGRVLADRPVGRGAQLEAVFSPDGRRLLAGGEDRAVRILDGTTARTLLTIDGLDSLIAGLGWSADGTSIRVSTHDGPTLIWSTGR